MNGIDAKRRYLAKFFDRREQLDKRATERGPGAIAHYAALPGEIQRAAEGPSDVGQIGMART